MRVKPLAMEHGTKERWSLVRSAGLGALGGSEPPWFIRFFHTFGGAPFDEDPLVHVLLDHIGFIGAGVLVLVIVSAIRNPLM
jgi:hypothetical protein